MAFFNLSENYITRPKTLFCLHIFDFLYLNMRPPLPDFHGISCSQIIANAPLFDPHFYDLSSIRPFHNDTHIRLTHPVSCSRPINLHPWNPVFPLHTACLLSFPASPICRSVSSPKQKPDALLIRCQHPVPSSRHSQARSPAPICCPFSLCWV